MKELLIEQNPHWRGEREKSVRRTKLEQLIRYLPLRQIVTISGIRRCGKSTLARQAIDHLISAGTRPENILFVNLEQPLFLPHRHDANHLNALYETYLTLANPQGRIYVIFDEVQFFENWQVFVKSRYEQSDIKFILTGSNSSMLSGELNTLLSGRSLNIHLDTFSFAEFLDYKQIARANEMERLQNRVAILRAKEEYLTWGGFFEVFDLPDARTKKELLTAYARNILFQDIIPRYGLRNSELIEGLFFHLLSHAGGLLNYTALAQTFGTSDKSIKEYVGYLEEVFLIHRLGRYHTKPKERIKSAKKLYAADNGFLQIAPRHSKNLGAALENLVFNTLRSRHDEMAYFQEKYEIDFVCDGALYQVAYDMDDPKTRTRELRAFEQPGTERFKKRCLITYDAVQAPEGVEALSLEGFLLQS